MRRRYRAWAASIFGGGLGEVGTSADSICLCSTRRRSSFRFWLLRFTIHVDVLLYSIVWPKYSRSGDLSKIPVGSGRADWLTESTSVAPTLEPHQGSPFVVKSWLSFLKCAASYSFSARMRSQPGLAPPGSLTKSCSYSLVDSP